MALAHCGCSIGRYYRVFANTDSIESLDVIKNDLQRKNMFMSARAYLTTLEAFPPGFTTTGGMPGKDLLRYKHRVHQRGLIEMAHEYLCVRGNGSVYWPAGASRPKSLQYPRDSYEIYYNIIWFFARWNNLKKGKRIRSKRPRQRQPQRAISSSRSSTPSLDGPLAPRHASPADEGGNHLPSSQSTAATQSTIPDAPVDERRQIPFGQRFSPDELAEDHYSQPNAQQHLSQVQQEQGSFDRVEPNRQPSPRVIRFEAAIPPMATVSAGTQTLDEEERPAREQNAPPPSSMNTNSASQGSNRAHHNHDNRTHPPSPMEGMERPRSPPVARPQDTRPMAECTIDFVVSYDLVPGFNFTMPLGWDIFSYSLERLFDKVNWQTNFTWLLIFLKAPSTSPEVRNPCFMECVPSNDERMFQTVLRRFKQQAENLRFCYTQLNRDAVIEVCFEPLVTGHTHSVHFDAWFRHAH